MTVYFTIPGEPQGKGRPRFNRYSGVAYTPERTASYENLIALFYKEEYGDSRFPDKTQLQMRIEAIFSVPKSTSKVKAAEMVKGNIRPTKKPDADNIIKVVCDALNGIAYRDDAQIVQVVLDKWYGTEPKVVVKITDEFPIAF